MKKKILAPVLAAVLLLSNGVTAFADEGVYTQTYDDRNWNDKDYAFEKPALNKPTPFEDAMLEMWQFTVDLPIFQKSQNFYSKTPNPNRKNPVRAVIFDSWSESDRVSKNWDVVKNCFYEYDLQGNLMSVYEMLPDGSPWETRQYAYDVQGRLTSDTDVSYWSSSPRINTRQYAYDAQGRLISEAEDGSIGCEYAYDAMGNVSMFDWTGVYKQSYARDEHGNVLTHIYGDDTKYLHNLTYDAQGRLLKDDISTIIGNDMCGSTQVKYFYDAAGNLLGREYIVNYPNETRVFQFTYDAMGNVLDFKGFDPSGQTEYGTDGNLTFMLAETYHYSGSDQLTYDAAGNVLTHVTEGGLNNIYRQYTYDEMGNLLTYTKDYCSPSSGQKSESHLIQYTYDEMGNLLTYTKATTNYGGRYKAAGETYGYRIQYFYE